jgi:hypothetical protein
MRRSLRSTARATRSNTLTEKIQKTEQDLRVTLRMAARKATARPVKKIEWKARMRPWTRSCKRASSFTSSSARCLLSTGRRSAALQRRGKLLWSKSAMRFSQLPITSSINHSTRSARRLW